MLEVCVDDIGGLQAAVDGGADRIELCSALSLGGLTPSAALIHAAVRSPIPVHVLLRPRAGDFVYNSAEEALIAMDLRMTAAAGLAGVVFGANSSGGELDVATLARLMACAREAGECRGTPLSVTLHRAFDLCLKPIAALEAAISLGFDRVLTSGGAATAMDGRAVIEALVKRSRGRIRVLAGSGINPTNVEAILATGADEIHASCRTPVENVDARVADLGFIDPQPRHTNAAAVSALIAAMESWGRKSVRSKPSE
jgi:copper homeostasis protein